MASRKKWHHYDKHKLWKDNLKILNYHFATLDHTKVDDKRFNAVPFLCHYVCYISKIWHQLVAQLFLFVN